MEMRVVTMLVVIVVIIVKVMVIILVRVALLVVIAVAKVVTNYCKNGCDMIVVTLSVTLVASKVLAIINNNSR
jgi:hypothetical protein